MVMACSYHLWCERGLDSVPPALGVEATLSLLAGHFPVIQAPGRKVTSIKISLTCRETDAAAGSFVDFRSLFVLNAPKGAPTYARRPPVQNRSDQVAR